MAFLAVTGPQELMLRLPSQESLFLGIVGATAEENDDGTWSVTVLAPEERVPALEALGYAVRVVTTDAELHDRLLDLGGPPPVA